MALLSGTVSNKQISNFCDRENQIFCLTRHLLLNFSKQMSHKFLKSCAYKTLAKNAWCFSMVSLSDFVNSAWSKNFLPYCECLSNYFFSITSRVNHLMKMSKSPLRI